MSSSSKVKGQVKEHVKDHVKGQGKEKDPWHVLGISRNCSDIKDVKSAYKVKRKQISSQSELSELRKAYSYLKESLAYRSEAEQIMEEMGTLESLGLPDSDSVRRTTTFEQPLVSDNSMIQDDDFDVDTILHRMMQDRPSSTSYKALLGQTQNGDYGGGYGGLTGTTPGAFGGFGELDGAAPILSDGDFMFVQGTSAAFEPGLAGNLNVDLDAFNDINDQVRGSISGGKLNKRQIKNYLELRDQAVTAPGPKMSAAAFQEHLGAIEQERLSNVAAEAQQNSHLVRQHLSRLTGKTRDNLFSYDNYRG